MKYLKLILNFIYTMIITAVISFGAAYFILFLSVYKNPRLFIIRSGSMSPIIPLGSVALIGQRIIPQFLSPLNKPLYQIDDVITYKSGKDIVTHRITNIKEEQERFSYQVKGDANKASDLTWVKDSEIIGTAVFSLPEMGKYIVFAKSRTGNIILVIIPVTILIYAEVLKIKSEISKIFKKKNIQTV